MEEAKYIKEHRYLSIERLKTIADEIESLRKEIYSQSYISDSDDKKEFDDILFQVQSKLRYNAVEILEVYES